MFVRRITSEVERNCPFHYFSWNKVPIECKRPIFPTLHHYFDLARYEGTEHWEGIGQGIQFDCARSYSDRKTELRAHFDANGGYDDLDFARLKPAPRIKDDAWVKVIDLLFLDPKYRNRSLKNKANRAKLPYSSSHGSQSYAHYRHMEEKKTGKSSYLKTWKHMHHKESPGFVNEAAEAVWDNIEKQLEVVSCEVGDENSVDEFEVLERALGSRRGHTRGVGRKIKDINPSMTSTSSFSSSQFDQIQQELQQSNERWQQQLNQDMQQQN